MLWAHLFYALHQPLIEVGRHLRTSANSAGYSFTQAYVLRLSVRNVIVHSRVIE